MWGKLQERQAVLKTEIINRDKVKRKHQTLTEHLEVALHKKQTYWSLLKKEQKDVENLDGFSILKVVRTWTGKQDEIREKELSELATIEAKYREIEKTVTDLEQDIVDSERELDQARWKSIDMEWETLMKEKEGWIYGNKQVEAARLDELYDQKTFLTSSSREITEAISAGHEAKIALRRALKSLEGAKDYSTWDTFLGGGLIATSLKHSKLDESENAIHAAQRSLQKFQTELLDIQQINAENLSVERDSFVTFADYIFDDIFSAWSTHSKINNSIDHINETISSLEYTTVQLEEQFKEDQDMLYNMEKEIAKIIEQ
ncbi:MAG: hypothetical protein WBB56_13895 [Psychrobacillus psychrotolerans]|uniref:hypothetical protein n=1 Tax=Psychrobacillus psychrotolerans TaxID=126156 RepID=UPI003BAF9EFC